MEKNLPFHQQLRRERKLRGWSQADLASKVESDLKTVSRWESGRSLPRPYHRQKLFELFEKNAEELGLFDDSKSSRTSPAFSTISQQITLPVRVHREDWGEAPHIENFYGRDKERVGLERWIVNDDCQVVTVLGMGGVGKTALSKRVVEQVKDTYEYIFWRSLYNAPTLKHILKQCILFLSDQQCTDLPDEEEYQFSMLIHYLRNHRCLLVLDNIESLLQAGQRAGQYREGYEDYGRLIQRIGETQHQSCLLLTSREKPKEIAHLEGKMSPVRSLRLLGVGQREGREILQDKSLHGTDEQWAALVHLYSGNPLALKLVSESIQEVFEGNIARFLQEEEIAFGDITDLLDQQFYRLSVEEQDILYWLAIEREAVALEDIRENLVKPLTRGSLLETMDSLRRRSMIETRGLAYFTLQPVIMEYLTTEFIKRVCRDFGVETPEAWMNYTLIKAQAKDYVRESQIRLILAPVAQQLLGTLGKKGLEHKLKRMLLMQRQEHAQQHNYFAGNVLNLLIYLQSDIRGFDFSHLVIWQAYLQHVALPDVNFAHAHFVASIFTNTFGNILSVAFHPSENLLAAGTATGEIWVYRALTGEPFLTCLGHTDGVWSVAFSPNGCMLASSSDDHTIRLWDINTGQCLSILEGHTNRVRSVAFSADGSYLASGSDDRTIRVWNVNTGFCFKILQGHTERVWSIALNSDGNLLATGSNDQTVRLWNIGTGDCLKILQGHSSWVRSVAFIPNGDLLASSSDDQTIRLWDVNTGDCLKILQGHNSWVQSVAFRPDSTLLASGSNDQSIRLWEVSTGDCLKTLQGHIHGVRCVTFHGRGQILASGGDDQTIRIWDVDTGYCLKTLGGYTNRVWSTIFSPKGTILASGSEDQQIRLWDVNTGHSFKTLQAPAHGVRALAFHPAENILASGGEDQSIRLWDISVGHCLKILRGHTNWVRSVVYSLDGRMLASGSEDRNIRLWDASTGHCLFTLQGHTDWVRSVAFSPTGNILASSSDDQTIRLWETKTGRYLQTLQGHTGRVRSVAFSPDGRKLVSGGEDRTIRLWDVSTGYCLKTLEGHIGWVRSVVFSPDGRTLVSSSDDQTIRLWEVDTGHCLHMLQGHTNRVRWVSFSPDGSKLASSSDDGTIKLWNAELADCFATLIIDV